MNFTKRLPLLLTFFLLSGLLFTTACRDDDPSSNGNTAEEITLTITSPEADSFQNTARIKVQGTLEGASSVDVNGSAASISGNTWEILLTFDEGPNTVTATAGDVSASVDFNVDTIGPELRIDSPIRGDLVDAAESDQILIAGQASDQGSGLFMIQVNGAIIDHEEDGSFSHHLEVREGLNVLSIKAFDRADNITTQWRSLIHGPITAPADDIDQALTVDVTPQGVNDIADVLMAYATPETVLGFLEVGLADTDLMINDLSWDDLQISIAPRDGYLELELYIEGLRIQGIYHAEDSEPIEGSIEVAELTVAQEIALDVDENNQLVVEVLSSHVDISASDIGGSLVADSNLLRSIVAGGIAYAFTDFFAEVIEGNLYDPDVLVREFEFLDRTIEISFLLQEILISPLGVRARLGLAFPAEPHPDVVAIAGALNREVGPDTGSSIERPFLLHSNRTAVDRTLHAIWQSGLFHQTIGGDDLDFQLPFPLTADGLASLLDQRIRDIHTPDTPVEFRLRPLLPPVMEFGPTLGDNSLQLDVGDLMIDFFLRPENGERTHILTIALYLEVDLEVAFDNFEISFEISLEAEGDVAEEPIFAFDRDRTVNLITDLLVLIPRLIGNDLTFDGQANFDWASLEDPEIEINGQARDRATFGVKLSPAEDFIEEDPVDPSELPD